MSNHVWCWEDGTEYGYPETTCTLPDEHDGDHEWIPDSAITITFLPEGKLQ